MTETIMQKKNHTIMPCIFNETPRVISLIKAGSEDDFKKSGRIRDPVYDVTIMLPLA